MPLDISSAPEVFHVKKILTRLIRKSKQLLNSSTCTVSLLTQGCSIYGALFVSLHAYMRKLYISGIQTISLIQSLEICCDQRCPDNQGCTVLLFYCLVLPSLLLPFNFKKLFLYLLLFIFNDLRNHFYINVKFVVIDIASWFVLASIFNTTFIQLANIL